MDMEDVIQKNFHKLRAKFAEGKTNRLATLRRLEQAVRTHEEAIYEALKQDLNKSRQETLMTELNLVYDELKHMQRKLKRYAKPRRTLPSLSQIPGRLEVRKEPYGVVLILSPWNYPLNLSLVPLIDAIAAGNVVYLKPSQDAPATSAALKLVLEELIDEDLVALAEGGREVNQALFEMPFDYFFFTGSPSVGKLVMKAAAEVPAPVTLELGGKSPAIVDKTAELKLTVKRILFGKLMNAGQTCVAPDYVCVHKDVYDAFVTELDQQLRLAIPDEAYFLEHILKIVSEKHYQRLKQRIDHLELLPIGAEVKFYPETRQIYPCFARVSWDAEIMEEEIFGPILPLLVWSEPEELYQAILAKPKPLALYLFSNEQDFIEESLRCLPSGGVCIQDTLLHMASSKAPFGGVGTSGFGNYHGEAGFKTFTQERTVLHKWKAPDIPWRHHPFTEKAFKILKKLLG